MQCNTFLFIKVLLANGANVDAASNAGERALMIAGAEGHLPIVEVGL